MREAQSGLLKPTFQAGLVLQNERTHEIAVVENDIGRIVLPKGSRKLLENSGLEPPLEAALREGYEEVGLQRQLLIGTPSHLGILVRPGFTTDTPHISAGIESVPSKLKVISVYHAVTSQDQLHPIEDDVVTAFWCHPHELYDVLTWQQEVDFIVTRQSKLLHER